MQRQLSSGGGEVPHKGTFRLRGQSTLEYVLIATVIGLVIVFAGPGVAGAIRNQFNQVTETLDEGTDGVAFKDPADIPDAKRGTAFAVYSADDDSLMFYKRRGVPKVGDMFNDRRVTAVYTGFETARYRPTADDYMTDPNGYNKAVDTSWYSIHDLVKSVRCVDQIRPLSMSYWFQHFRNCTAFDISKVDTSACASFEHTFFACRTVTQLDLDDWNMTKAETAGPGEQLVRSRAASETSSIRSRVQSTPAPTGMVS